MTDGPDDRSSFAIAYGWASRIIGVSIAMVLPGLLGVWLDWYLETICLFTILGFAGGMVYGIWHLIRMTSPSPGRVNEERDAGERVGK